MKAFAKRIAGALRCDRLARSGYQIRSVDLARDWEDINELLTREQWPFVRADLEASHNQPTSEFVVATKDGRVQAFFATHAFGTVGYLDMMIVAKQARRCGVARPLYFQTVRRLRRRGVRTLVVHTTNDSARLIRLLRFKAGQSFTLLAKDPVVDGDGTTEVAGGSMEALGSEDLPALVDLDRHVFGERRVDWLRTLVGQPSNRFYGLRADGELVASVCLRQRRGGAICIDGANANDFEALASLVRKVVAVHQDIRIECFVRTDGALHRVLAEAGFRVPDFFVKIGPLVEWRKGRKSSVGAGQEIQSLNWF